MFFRRQRGEYRETDRVTRYKLIKSGKHWLRASTSLFGLFKVMRGGVDATQVKTELVEDQASQKLTALDLLKGVAATGTILGGFAATQTRVYANDTVAVEKTVEYPVPGEAWVAAAPENQLFAGHVSNGTLTLPCSILPFCAGRSWRRR